MNNYNTHLENLRKEKGLSLKEAAKAIGISRWSLYFYENGYFRPSKKALQKLTSFYGEEISIEGVDAYPAPNKEKVIKKEKQTLKVKRIVFGSLSGALLLTIIAGAILFNSSVNNNNSFYGQTYNEMDEYVSENGDVGHDLVTSLPYHYVSKSVGVSTATMIFYETDNMLYFNECTYSVTTLTEAGMERYHFNFGSNLGASSYRTEFTYGNWFTGTYISCYFDYNGEKISKVIIDTALILFYIAVFVSGKTFSKKSMIIKVSTMPAFKMGQVYRIFPWAAALCIAAGLIHLLITLLERKEYLEEGKES